VRKFNLLIATLLIGGTVSAADTSPNLGTPATAEDVAKVYWSTTTDGDNLPAGKGSAKEGEALYAASCIACHGAGGKDGVSRALVGGVGSLATDKPVKSLGSFWPYSTTVFDYVRRAMPYTAPMSLTNDEYYAITAYLLYINGIVKQNQVLDAKSLPKVKMPNRDGFVLAYPQRPKQYDYLNK
jgi:mono/diheme cytochrome c family protein